MFDTLRLMTQMMWATLSWVKRVKIWINAEILKVSKWIENKQTFRYNETDKIKVTFKLFCNMSEIMSEELSLEPLEIESISGKYKDNIIVLILLFNESGLLWGYI